MPSAKLYTVPISHIIREGFDYYGFVQAVQKDEVFSADEKRDIIHKLNPSQTVQMNLNAPETTLDRLLSPNNALNTGHRVRLREDHPTAQMWQEVWKEALDHYAPQVAKYDEKMRKNASSTEGRIGESIQYPHLVPPVFLENTETSNASAGINPRSRNVEVSVTSGLLKLPPVQQRAVLQHEAQHLLEPMLQGMDPLQYKQLSGIVDRVTHNAHRRHLEHKADTLPAALGNGQAQADFFVASRQVNAEATAPFQHLMAHLKNAGFKLDGEAFATTVMELRQADQASNGAADATGRKKASAVLGDGKETHKLHTTADKTNAVIGHPAEPRGMRGAIDKIKAHLSNRGATHPEDYVRIARLRHHTPPPASSASKPSKGRDGR